MKVIALLMIVLGLFSCNENKTVEETPRSDETVKKSTSVESDLIECDPVFESLTDVSIGSSYVQININLNDSIQTVLVDNLALFHIVGEPDKTSVEYYAKQLHPIIKNKSSLMVTDGEYEALRDYFFETKHKSDLVLEAILGKYFENGKQIKLIPNEHEVISLLLDSNYIVSTNDYTGDLFIRKCED